MKRRLRPWRELLRIAGVTLRLEPRRAALTMLPITPICGGVAAVSLRGVVDAAGRGDRTGVLVAACVAGVATGGIFVAIYWQIATGGMRLSEVTGVELDRMLMARSTASSSVALFDAPDVLDRIELIRVNKQALATPVALVRDILWVTGNVMVSSLLLAAVDVRFAVIGVLVLPVGWTYYRGEDISDRAERAMAAHRREALHLFDIGTSADAGKELRTFRQGDAVRARYRRTWSDVDATLTRAYARAAAVRVAVFAAVSVAVGWVLLAVTHDIGAGHLGPVDALLLVMGVTGLADAVGFMGMAASAGRRAIHVVNHFLTVMDRAPAANGAQPAPDRLVGGISLRDVRFSYPGGDAPVIDGIDLDLAAGTTVAIVGENGAGKSTLVKLLCGLYTPDHGTIAADDIPLDDIDDSAWTARVGLVAQDFTRFELLARETVGVGDIDRIDDAAHVAAAVDRAGASTVIDGLPGGFDTQLGSRFGGNDLSGGQWQRLAVARGMMRRGPLLLAMDEPTGALDARTEQELLARCLEDSRQLAASVGTIVVYVSHRYSTVRLADRIIVLDAGRVVEDGTHAELIAHNGRYAHLYKRQAQAYA